MKNNFLNDESKLNVMTFSCFFIVYEIGIVIINLLEKSRAYSIDYISLKKNFVLLTLTTFAIYYLINYKKIESKDKKFIIFIWAVIAYSGYSLIT